MSILDSVLTKRQKEAGLYLETDTFLYSNLLYLKRDNKILTAYSLLSLTFDQIRHDADQILNWDKSGITFGRV